MAKISSKFHIIITIVILIVFAIILSRLNYEKALHALAGVEWVWVICAGLVNILNTYIEAIRWKLILSSVKKKIHVNRTFSAILVGVVGNTILPLRLGDGARAYFLAKKESLRLASVFSTVLLDRVADVICFLLFVALTTLLYHFPSSVIHVCLAVGIVIALIIIIFIVLRKLDHHIKLEFKGKLKQKLVEQLKHFLHGLSALQNKGLLLPAMLLSIISWIMRAMIVWAMLMAFQLDLILVSSKVSAMVVLILTNLGIAIVSTPANVGGFELSAVAALHLFIRDAETAISFAVALHLVEVVPIVILGLIVLWYNGFNLLKSSRELRESLKENDNQLD
jgi:uncharacterized protein (TIRG00374 family)